MNERIKELLVDASKPENRMNFVTYDKLTNEKLIEFAIQSGVHPFYLDSENPGNSLTGSLAKFAELIVRECAYVSEGYFGFKDHTPGTAIAKEMKDHFGVEE